MGQDLIREIVRLRSKGWSDKSIARHLKTPLDVVRAELGIPTYTADGKECIRVVELAK